MTNKERRLFFRETTDLTESYRRESLRIGLLLFTQIRLMMELSGFLDIDRKDTIRDS